MRDLRELAELHLHALLVCDESGRLAVWRVPEAARAPHVFLLRTVVGNLWRVHRELPDEVARELARLCATEPVAGDFGSEPRCAAGLRRALRGAARIDHEHRGPAYVLPDAPASAGELAEITEQNAEALLAGFPDLARGIAGRLPCRARLVEGSAAAVCYSARLAERAAEAGVETLPRYRRRGFATQVVAGWAAAVQAQGRLALYSTTWDNTASRGVAQRLGGRLYAEDFHLD